MKKYKIVSPVRFFIFILIVTITLSFTFVSVTSLGQTDAMSTTTYKQVEVHEGDSLWTIIDEYIDTNTDTRIVVEEVCELNDISANDIQPGDLLLLPMEV